MNGPNSMRATPLGPIDLPILTFSNDPCRPGPWTGRTSPICAAGTRARAEGERCGFDLICLWRPWVRHHPAFPVAAINQRRDDYGGSLENRAHSLRN